ncbi:MAG: histidine phosphatase family protein [Oscillospiraceae bacterium]|nr:histidine phosphatase family protein [Oscillospiraceae bacterium]
MVEVYIVRHGETDSNIRQACVGHKDVPLNSRGVEQVQNLAAKLINVEFDVVYVSPLIRALDTAAPLRKKAPMVMSYGLIERDYGDWDDMTFEEIRAAAPDKYREWQENPIDFRIPNGESAAMVQERVNEIMDKIISENDGKRVLVVTHLGTARHIISHLLGLTAEESWRFTLDNAKAAVIQTDKGKGLLKYLNIC